MDSARRICRSRRRAAPRVRLAALGTAAALTLATFADAQNVQTDPRKRPRQFQPNVQTYRPSNIDYSELEQVPVDPHVIDLVKQLDADAFIERETAMDDLIDYRCDIEQLLAVLYRYQLSPEQHHRLLTVVYEHSHAPRGAVGIRINNARQVEGIFIESLIPGLPAERVLELGDRITHLDRKPVTWNSFQREVQEKRPGDRVHLTIQRLVIDERGNLVKGAEDEPLTEPVEVEIDLGSWAKLQEETGAQRMSLPGNDRGNVAREARTRLAPIHQTLPVPTPEYREWTEGEIREAVEQDASIQKLRNDIVRYRRGRIPMSNRQHAIWALEIERLRQAAAERGLADTERRYREMVLERFREMIPK